MKKNDLKQELYMDEVIRGSSLNHYWIVNQLDIDYTFNETDMLNDLLYILES